MTLYTVKITDPDGNVVFAGYLEPDQFTITHYPHRPSTLEINLDPGSWSRLTVLIDEHLKSQREKMLG